MITSRSDHHDVYAERRGEMVRGQLEARGISDARVLEAMSSVPREVFVPDGTRSAAYEDRALPTSLNQTISQPYMVALMTERLDPQPGHRVLEIGTGSGYQTAILAKLVERVYTIERLGALSQAAQQTLAGLGVRNVSFRVADGTLGWEEFSPYDRIVVTAASPRVPETLVDQLVDGGIMIIPVGPEDSQMLMAVRKSAGAYTEQAIVACRFVKLKGACGWPEDSPE